MDEIVCPYCSVKIPLGANGEGLHEEFVECPGCGMLVDLKEMKRRKDEQSVAIQWASTQSKHKREVNLVLVFLLLGSIIAGVTIYIFWILNRYD
ncbi:hypothetical protein J7M28_02830 [bacterium]|nr:hypothetical protein [bacterium]